MAPCSAVRNAHPAAPVSTHEPHAASGQRAGFCLRTHLPTNALCAAKAVRNVSGLPFLSRCTGADREQVENLLHTALASLSGEVSGAYERLSDMDPDDEDALAREGLMLEKPEPGSLAVACGAAREWPDHRGVFRDEDSSVVCWVNGPEDHCTLWVMQRDHDVFAAFRKLCLLHQV